MIINKNYSSHIIIEYLQTEIQIAFTYGIKTSYIRKQNNHNILLIYFKAECKIFT